LNLKGIQTIWQKSQKFLKILSSYDLQNMNLDGLTCMQSFKVSLQVVNKTWFKYKEGFEFEFKFTPRYNVDYIEEIL
jgi:hypothetical protein